MTHLLSTRASKIFGIMIGLVLVLVCTIASVVFGLTDITWQTAVQAYTQFDGSNEHVIIKTTRVPRALIASAVGMSLAIAGGLLQGVTRNPLSSPSVLGINQGASFFIVVAVSFLAISSLSQFIWIAFLGAGVTFAMVYLLGSLGREGLSPIKLTLAGAAMAALFSSLTQGILVLNDKAHEEVLFWLAGSVEGRKLEILFQVLPYMVIGWIAAILIAKPMNILIMGEDVAKGLGQRTALVKIVTGIIIILLAGGAVSVAGPIPFVGVVVPHIARYLVGVDYRWVIPYSGLLGAILLLLADIGARFIIMPKEVPIGVMTALIGVPFFIYIARRGITKS